MIRTILSLLILISTQPAAAQDAGWGGAYGGLSLDSGGQGPGVFVGAQAETGAAVLGLEIGAGEGDVALVGRLGAGLGDTLLYGLAGLDGAEGEDGEAGVVVGAGAARRLWGLRLGGELRHDVSGAAQGETRLGGRVALEF